MSIKIFDRVKQKTSSLGTGIINLDTSIAAFLDFSDVYSDGDQTYYAIENPTSFEIGIGTYSGNTLSRDTILNSSNSNNRLNLPGDSNTFVFVTYPASGAVYTSSDRIITNIDGINFPDGNIQTIAYTGQQADTSRRDYINVSGNTQLEITDEIVFIDSSFSTINIILPPASGNGGKEISFKWINGSNTVQLLPSGSETIDGNNTWGINYIYESFSLISNNQNWYIF